MQHLEMKFLVQQFGAYPLLFTTPPSRTILTLPCDCLK